MDSQTVTAEKKISPRSWHWSLILFFSLLAFLMLGAFAFRAAEKEHSAKANQLLLEGLGEFLENHACLSPSDLQLFGSNVSYYLSRGVSLMRRYRIDTKATEIESTWSLSNAAFFSFTIVTTIGYGRLVPQTNTGKVFCMFYAMVGIPLLAFTLSFFGKTLEEFARKYTAGLKLYQSTTPWRKLRLVTVCLSTAVFLILFLIIIPGYLVSVYERWEFWDSCYFLFITITTIGFGDLSVGDCQRCGISLWLIVVCFILYVFIGMCVISFLFTAVSEYQKKKLQTAESLLVTFVSHHHDTQEVNTSGSVSNEQPNWRTTRKEGALYKTTVGHDGIRSSDGGIVNCGLEHDHGECDFDVHSASKISYPFVQLHPRTTHV